jgi:hypothetical protein
MFVSKQFTHTSITNINARCLSQSNSVNCLNLYQPAIHSFMVGHMYRSWLSICRWPWHNHLPLGKKTLPLLVAGNQRTPVKKTYLADVQSRFFACQVIMLFSTVFCVVTADHKFDFRLVRNKTSNTRQCHAVTETNISERPTALPWQSPVLWDPTQNAQVNRILLNKQYTAEPTKLFQNCHTFIISNVFGTPHTKEQCVSCISGRERQYKCVVFTTVMESGGVSLQCH